jgi:hypothetical protein
METKKMDKELRVFAGQIVVESKMSKAAKLQMLNFIKEEATDAQIKALLMDGKIVKLDEQAEEIVNDRFENHEINEAGGRVAKLRKTYMSQAGSGGGLNVFWLAYRTIRAQFDKCTKRCGAYELNTSRRQHCMIKCKEAKARAELAAAKKANDEKRIKKAAKDLQKVQALLKKSTASFTKRGADI